jgi:lipoprotein-anchoring transpeptidase ErfK/SrfK
MQEISRRKLLKEIAALGAAGGAAAFLQACGTSGPVFPGAPEPLAALPGSDTYARLYGPVLGEQFTVSAIDLSKIDAAFLRREVNYETEAKSGSIVVDPEAHYLYYIMPGGQAVRYGVGVGKQGFEWNGVATIRAKLEWPDWYPPPEMIERRPDIVEQLEDMPNGMKGVPGGPRNPLGARGMYLWQGGKDTLYRIHGTLEPNTIGQSVSSGCIRMINQDVIDLYQRVELGAEVKVLASKARAGLV